MPSTVAQQRIFDSAEAMADVVKRLVRVLAHRLAEPLGKEPRDTLGRDDEHHDRHRHRADEVTNHGAPLDRRSRCGSVGRRGIHSTAERQDERAGGGGIGFGQALDF